MYRLILEDTNSERGEKNIFPIRRSTYFSALGPHIGSVKRRVQSQNPRNETEIPKGGERTQTTRNRKLLS